MRHPMKIALQECDYQMLGLSPPRITSQQVSAIASSMQVYMDGREYLQWESREAGQDDNEMNRILANHRAKRRTFLSTVGTLQEKIAALELYFQSLHFSRELWWGIETGY